MTRTIEQNARLHKLLGLLGITADQKETLVLSYTYGRTASSADMSGHECDELLRFLQQQYDARLSYHDSRSRAMRRRFFSLVREKGWTVDNKINYDRVNAWLTQYGYLHKPLNKYTYAELPKLLSQFERV